MSNNVTDKWGILYCPKGGLLSNPKRRWERIEAALHEQNIEFDKIQSESVGSVDRLITMMIANGYKTIVIVGGDSALNDAVNCIMQTDKATRESIVLGVIPNGMMNDFAHFWGFDEGEVEQNVAWLKARRVRKIDLGCIRYTNKKQEKCHRYFNVVVPFLVHTSYIPAHGVPHGHINQLRPYPAKGDDGVHRQRFRLRTDPQCSAIQRAA